MERGRVAAAIVFGLVALGVSPARAGQAVVGAQAQHTQEYRHYDGPPVTLQALLQEAAEKNPDLIALRRQIDILSLFGSGTVLRLYWSLFQYGCQRYYCRQKRGRLYRPMCGICPYAGGRHVRGHCSG